jgi:non-ribosomal peptide synthetase-like protein
VTIGDGAVLEVRSGTGGDVEIGRGARLQALAHLPSGARVPAGERWDGVPARPCGRAAPPPAVSLPGARWSPARYSWHLLGSRVLRSPGATLPLMVAAVAAAALLATDSVGVAAWVGTAGPWSSPLWCVVVLLLVVLAVPLSLLLQGLMLRWSRPVPMGTHDRWSPLHLRHVLRNDALEAAGEWLAGTLFWPLWLRLSGMRVGRDCEISTIAGTLPEHVAIGGGSFLADGVYLGVCDVHAGAVTVAPTQLGVRTFLGNHVVVPAGQRLPDDVLLGVCTVADAGGMAAGTAWFGQPPFGLPRREIVRADPRLTHRPGPLRWSVRVSWELLRLLLPAVPVLLWLSWFHAVAPAAQRGFWPGALAAGTALLGLVLGQLLFVLATKWALLGRARPGQHGLWSAWASRWDFHYVVWERCGRPLLSHLEGTAWLPWFLRAIGVRIGRRVVLGDGFAQVVDPDMLTIEDDATMQALFQAHSFEDRVLKLDRVRIGRAANVGRGAVVLYGADVGDGALVAPHSVVMKHERLSPGRHYAGVPTEEVGAAAPPLRRAGRR